MVYGQKIVDPGALFVAYIENAGFQQASVRRAVQQSQPVLGKIVFP